MTTRDEAKTDLPALRPRRPDVAQALIRAEVMTAFLDAYRADGTISGAAKAAGISRETHYRWLEEYPDYAEKWAAAQDDANESLLREAIRRGRDGVDVGVWHQGTQVGTEKKYSDNLLMFMIKGRMPQYKDRMELTGADGGPVQVQSVRSDALARLDPVQLAAIRALNASVAGALPGEVVEESAALEAPESPDDPATFAPESDALKAKDGENRPETEDVQ